MIAPHVTEDLSLYLLDLLEERERARVEGHLHECATCRAAMLQEEETLWALAEAGAREPRPELRAAIVERHQGGGRRGERAAAGVRLRDWVLALNKRGLAFAALLVLTLAGLGGLVASQQQLASERALRDEYARALEVVARGANVVALEARGTTGRGALVLPREGEPFLLLALPEPPAGKVYEAWVIRGGTPIPAGLAAAHPGLATIRLTETVRPGDLAAVTLEATGGVQRPTREPILVGGG